MQQAQKKESHGRGWGADLEKENRPGVPKEWTSENGSSGHDAHWDKHTQQVPDAKVFHTIERPGITPVFGSTCPPRGISGKVRDLAFRYSEDKLRHWVLLMFADRVDMMEGWVEDLGKGNAPMILPRMEFRTLDKLRNPKSRPQALVALGAVAVVLGAGAWLLLRSRGTKGVSGAAYALDPGESGPDLP